MFVPQLLEKTPTKFRIYKISYCKNRDILENRDETTLVCVCGGGCDTPCLYPIGYTHTI
jgi:hypothetical protein